MNTNKYTIILESERLILRTWIPNDIPVMAKISSNPIVMEHFPYTQDLSATKKMVHLINEHHHEHGYALYAVDTKNTGEFIGFVGLSHPSFDIPHFMPRGLPIVEIGWRLSADHWGRGYATEAAISVLNYAFTTLNLNEVISFTVAANVKSRRVMEKIGLHHNAADDFIHPRIDEKSSLKNHVLYRLTAAEYYKQSVF